MTTLRVPQNAHEALNLADRGYVIQTGRIIARARARHCLPAVCSARPSSAPVRPYIPLRNSFARPPSGVRGIRVLPDCAMVLRISPGEIPDRVSTKARNLPFCGLAKLWIT